jgi:hypothetical protein
MSEGWTEEMQQRYVAEQNARDAAWPVIQSALRCLAERRPSGDDSVYDYWPNALEAISALYAATFCDGINEIEDYLIQHLDESCGSEITQAYLEALAELPEPPIINYLIFDGEDLEDSAYGRMLLSAGYPMNRINFDRQ